jgi:type I restriction enzyme, S subunit
MLKEVQNLPHNWKKVSIPDVLFFQEGPGVRKWQFTQEGVKLLNGGNINNNAINLDSTKIYISEEEAQGKYSHFMIDPGDLVIACSGIVVNKFKYKIALIEEKHTPLCLNTSTMRFKSLGDIDLKYYAYFLQTEYFSKQLQRLITGSAQLNFGPSHIKKMEVLLPPLEEQKKIAAILDAADDYRQKTKALIDKYDKLTQSLFLDMFGELLQTRSNIITLEELCGKGKYGSGASAIQFDESLPRYVRITDINDSGDLNDKKMSPSEFDEQYILRKNDLLFARTGATVGKTYLYKESDGELIYAGYLIKFNIPKPHNALYFFHFTKTNYYKSWVDNQQNVVAQPNINAKQYGNELEIPLPPIKLQNLFAERVTQIEEQKQQAEASLVKAEELFSSLLQRAFKGELTS